MYIHLGGCPKPWFTVESDDFNLHQNRLWELGFFGAKWGKLHLHSIRENAQNGSVER